MPGPDPHAILIIRPSALGDVCRTVPVLVSLRARFPTARIDWLVQDTFAEAIAHHPALGLHGQGGVIGFPRRELAKWWTPGGAAAAISWMSGLRHGRREGEGGETRRGYDLVIDCQGLFRSGLFAWWTRAPVRIGARQGAELGWLGVNRRIDVPKNQHTVDRMLALALAGGAQPIRDLRLYTSPVDRAWVAGLRPGLGRFALLAPTSRWAGKLWPAERHAELAERLLADRSFELDTVAIVGGAGERAQIAPLLKLAEREARVIDLTGRTTIGQLMSVVEASSLVVASDSATLHMGVGFGRPLVGLFGPTDVALVGPYGRSAHVLSRVEPGERLNHKDGAAGAAMMARISVEDVLALAAAQIGGGR